MSGVIGKIVGIAFLAAGASACASSDQWGNRYGPRPEIVPTDAENFATRQQAVLAGLAAGSGATIGVPESGYVDYYEVVQTGFNYVDEKCDNYLRELFKLDRRRDRVQRGTLLLDKSSSAVLGAVEASSTAILVVAQTFGLAGGFADIFADSYLYDRDPSLLFSTVDKLRVAYRKQTVEDKGEITSASAAYGRIRGYLALCMPQTIEAKINERIASSDAVTKPEDEETPSANQSPAPASVVPPSVTLQ